MFFDRIQYNILEIRSISICSVFCCWILFHSTLFIQQFCLFYIFVLLSLLIRNRLSLIYSLFSHCASHVRRILIFILSRKNLFIFCWNYLKTEKYGHLILLIVWVCQTKTLKFIGFDKANQAFEPFDVFFFLQKRNKIKSYQLPMNLNNISTAEKKNIEKPKSNRHAKRNHANYYFRFKQAVVRPPLMNTWATEINYP